MNNIRYEWTILGCEVYQNFLNHKNVVKKIEWKLTATDGVYSASAEGNTELSDPVNNFILFENLTKDMVISWIESGLSNYDEIKKLLETDVLKQNIPKTIRMNLPFQ